MDKTIQFKQIVLVTDGQSNIGANPVVVSKEAYEKGITVNTIGIINSGNSKEEPMEEVQKIAQLGGGVCELTDLKNFSRTFEAVTQKSIYKTIEEAVSNELKKTLGTSISDMHPDSRRKIIDVIDRLGDQVDIEFCVVIDLSGSMANKINIAKNSMLSLLRVMQGRKGRTEIAIIGYPGKNGETYEVLCNFTSDISRLEEGMCGITTGGATPTGPALKAAIELLHNRNNKEVYLESNIV